MVKMIPEGRLRFASNVFTGSNVLNIVGSSVAPEAELPYDFFHIQVSQVATFYLILVVECLY